MAKKLIQCKTCGETIAKSAKRCPHCGARNGMSVGQAILTAFGVLIALFVLLIVVAINSESGDSTPSGGSVSPSGGSGVSVSSTDKPAPTESSKSSSDSVGIDETLEAQHFSFTIRSAECRSSVTNALGVTYSAGEGETLLVAVLDAKNTDSETQNVDFNGFNSYVDGNKVVTQLVGGNMVVIGEIGGNMPLLGAVSAGMNFTGYVVWEIPEDWETFQFSYIDSLTGRESKSSFHIYADDVQK